MHPAKAIPEKLFFKIGEVCELVEVQPHVLRYWESEFPMLAPQKNSAGQRVYRRKDVDIVFRIRELLYDEKFTIAGAKQHLAKELRGGAARLKVVPPPPVVEPTTAPVEPVAAETASATAVDVPETTRRAIGDIRRELEGLLTMLGSDATKTVRR